MSDSIAGSFLAACKTGGLDRVAAAITLGVNVNVTNIQDTNKDHIGLTGLMLGILNNHPGVVDLLLDQPAIDKNKKVTAAGTVWPGLTALQVACWRVGRPWAVARLGREGGLEVNSQGWNGWPPLTTAAINGYLGCIKELIKLPACQVNAVDGRGDTALIVASELGKLECARELLGVPGIDINLKGKDGRTALSVAVETGQVDIAKELLKVSSVDLSVKTSDGKTLEQAARALSLTALLPLLPGTIEHARQMEENIRNLQIGARKTPDCPVCFTELAPPVRIFQCGNGHFICGGCKPGIQICPTCREPMVGRAHGMESYLRGGPL